MSDSRDDPAAVASILVPEIRDYLRINAEVVNLLDRGQRRIRLDGVGGQRLLLAGLVGSWEAVIEVDGRTGPELAAKLAAPGLLVVAHGSTADGAGSGLQAGTVIVLGDAGAGLGYGQVGGRLIARGDGDDRAGLNQRGGVLAILGASGRLTGERQTGGILFMGPGGWGPHAGRGQRGGRRLAWADPLEPADHAAWAGLTTALTGWVDPALMLRPTQP